MLPWLLELLRDWVALMLLQSDLSLRGSSGMPNLFIWLRACGPAFVAVLADTETHVQQYMLMESHAQRYMCHKRWALWSICPNQRTCARTLL